MNTRKFRMTALLFLAAAVIACEPTDDGATDGSNSGLTGVPEITATHQVLAFNDLGMHCADLDYSTFVILPPFNVVRGQVIERGAEPRILDDTEAALSYHAVADASASINTTSQNQAGAVHKTNFWDTNPATGNSYVFDLFGLDPVPDEGLAFGQTMPGILSPYSANDPQPFNHYDASKAWFSADGVPVLPVDDAGQRNAYPLMRVEARLPASGETVASLDVVLPVASEADCQNCHALGEIAAPLDSPVDFMLPDDVNDPNSVLQAAKHNILVLHDDRHGTRLIDHKPVLCAACHYSAALDLAGTGPSGSQLGKPTMSAVMHGHHGALTNDAGDPLFPSGGTLEETCYQCHPGKVTKCLRGAMGGAGIECSDCHGSMLAVGRQAREPWIDEPRCESCHTGDALDHAGAGIRFSQAWSDDIDTATPRIASNKRFAENAGTLYRNSLGHGGVACEGCHGSTHAIWPNAMPDANDNVAANQLQGHAGTITECATCHTSLPLTLDGPHGMHNVNSAGWNLGHEEFYERNPNACRACHGQNLEGTVLSVTAADRTYLTDDEGDEGEDGEDENDDDDRDGDDHFAQSQVGGSGTISVAAGTQVSCDLCHEKP